MAPKAPAPKTAHKKTKQKSSPSGLQLSGAQWKAYGAAYSASASAAYRKLAIQSAAQGLRQSRLGAAHKLQKITAATHAKARTAAIASYAVGQSYRQARLAHQNAALVQRVYADFERHILLAGRLQYAYKGEKAFTHAAVMRTLTTAQAVSAEEIRFAQAAKSAKSALRSTAPAKPNAARSAAVAKIQANAKAAALAAARATPKGRTAPRPARLGPLCNARHRDWFGDPEGYDCLAAAFANSIRLDTSAVLNPEQYAELVKLLGPSPEIEHAACMMPAWTIVDAPRLANAEPDDPALLASGHVIGFQSQLGPHAALYLGAGLIASWGETMLLADVIAPGTAVEEAWDLRWEPATASLPVCYFTGKGDSGRCKADLGHPGASLTRLPGGKQCARARNRFAIPLNRFPEPLLAIPQELRTIQAWQN